MRTPILSIPELRILIVAITFFALLVILILPDSYLGSGLFEPGWLPIPMPK